MSRAYPAFLHVIKQDFLRNREQESEAMMLLAAAKLDDGSGNNEEAAACKRIGEPKRSGNDERQLLTNEGDIAYLGGRAGGHAECLGLYLSPLRGNPMTVAGVRGGISALDLGPCAGRPQQAVPTPQLDLPAKNE
ncbi:hypothetical protein R1flu_011982 [Riccia fluitans]|uniref:Uncharacterized protein n=1 Tax=Riccia fluitans TaxID=41844 RepID=A0ABD1Z9I9_9MARC